ncbi:hypothetical protein [Streptomyces sp. FXJ7.023]|nr:hypothetical protein [Streptomyces sp. FXJ7.023]
MPGPGAVPGRASGSGQHTQRTAAGAVRGVDHHLEPGVAVFRHDQG